MPKKKFKRNSLFEFLGCHLNNPRWSWCSLSTEENRAVFAIWEDREQSGRWRLTPEESSKRLGAKEQREISRKSYEQKIPTFGIICVAKDVNVLPRAVKDIKGDELVCLRLVEENGIIYGIRDGIISTLEFGISKRHNKKNAVDDLSEIPEGNEVPDRAKKVIEVVKRDNKVRRYVIKRAQGKCEHCGVRGFAMPNGKFYVETHHIIALCNSGRDKIDNVIGLCPTHHREAHYGAEAESLEAEFDRKLKEINKK